VDRSNDLRRLRSFTQSASNLPDQNVQIGFCNVAVRPDLLEEFFFTDHTWPPGDQGAKQVERFGGQMNLTSITKKLPRVRIDCELQETRFHGPAQKLQIL
jgi:hypothetical protein